MTNLEMLEGIDADLLQTYDTRAPRYTSYPTAPQWDAAFTESDYRDHLSALPPNSRLSLYVHLPFCLERCTFCGCNVVISKRRSISGDYLDSIEQEADLLRAAIPAGAEIAQLHWGGGTPNYLPPDEMRRLHAVIADRFPIAEHAEIALELDPRHLTDAQIATLAELGFNRASLGVQDTSKRVQQAVNRIQPSECVQRSIDGLRAAGFNGINVDLIYGLPHQTLESWSRTLDEMVDFKPDRVAMYGFAFLPEKLRQQVKLDSDTLPDSRTRFELFLAGLRWFTEHGYSHIGMDHFATPTDELSTALREHSLRRNFMGYTTLAGTEGVCLGTSAIAQLSRCFAQSDKHLASYRRSVAAGRLPIDRGMTLSRDDEIRSAVIHELMCFSALDTSRIEARFDGLDFTTYFADECAQLKPLERDGLLHHDGPVIRTSKLGQILLRNIASVFDAYLGKKSPGDTATVYSRTV